MPWPRRHRLVGGSTALGVRTLALPLLGGRPIGAKSSTDSVSDGVRTLRTASPASSPIGTVFAGYPSFNPTCRSVTQVSETYVQPTAVYRSPGKPKQTNSLTRPIRPIVTVIAVVLAGIFIASSVGPAQGAPAQVTLNSPTGYDWFLNCSAYGPTHGQSIAGWSWLHNAHVLKTGSTPGCVNGHLTGTGTRPARANGLRIWVGGSFAPCAKNTTTRHFTVGGIFSVSAHYSCRWTGSGGFGNGLSDSFTFRS